MYTLNGVGTRFVGRKDDQPDGYYTTTKWGVFLYMPVFYKGTFKVRLSKDQPGWRSTLYETIALEDDDAFIRSIKIKYWSCYALIFFYHFWYDMPEFDWIFSGHNLLWLIGVLMWCVIVTAVIMITERKSQKR